MRRPIAVLISVAALAVAAQAASAGRLSVDSGSFRIIWNEVTFSEASSSVRCHMTLGGTFAERSFYKEEGLYKARANEGSIAGCSGGSATLGWLPMFFYMSFSGTLPNIAEMNMKVLALEIEIRPGFFGCRIWTELYEPAVLRLRREAGGKLTRAEFHSSYSIRPYQGITCVERWTISGAGDIWRLGTTNLQFSLLLI